MQRRNAIPLLLLLLCLASAAHAQSNPQQLADANRAAMDAYNNLDIEAAKKTLEDAAKNAEKNGIKGPALARTYANLGVVYVGGLSDNASGLDAFVKALKEDPNVEPDPLVSTPEIQQVFSLAKRKAGTGGGGSSVTPPPPPAPVEGNLEHVPAREQLSQTAVPVFVKSGDLPVASMKVFYRSLGMPQPKSADMKEMEGGWGVLIPCTDVFEPTVEYFVVALDDEGAQIGNAGTPQNPVSVPVVSQRSAPAASLPGQMPPSQCSGDNECPPGMPGCAGKGGLGDTCRSDSDCGEGLICSDDFCATGEREDDDDDKGSKSDSRFFIDATFGLGVAYVGNNMEADAAPAQSVTDAACNSASPKKDCKAAGGDMGVDIAAAKTYLADRGWACDVAPGKNMAGQDAGIVVSNCSVALDKSGFVPVPIFNVAAGYYITPRFALAVTGRIQIGHGEGTLAGILLGARGQYLITKPANEGFHASLMGGVGFGRIQVQPPAKTAGAQGPYVTSGPVGVSLGLRAGYRFTKNFGLLITPAANFMLPTFLFAIDATGGIEVAF